MVQNLLATKKTILNGHRNQAIYHKKCLAVIQSQYVKVKLHQRLTNQHIRILGL